MTQKGILSKFQIESATTPIRRKMSDWKRAQNEAAKKVERRKQAAFMKLHNHKKKATEYLKKAKDNFKAADEIHKKLSDDEYKSEKDVKALIRDHRLEVKMGMDHMKMFEAHSKASRG